METRLVDEIPTQKLGPILFNFQNNHLQKMKLKMKMTRKTKGKMVKKRETETKEDGSSVEPVGAEDPASEFETV